MMFGHVVLYIAFRGTLRRSAAVGNETQRMPQSMRRTSWNFVTAATFATSQPIYYFARGEEYSCEMAHNNELLRSLPSPITKAWYTSAAMPGIRCASISRSQPVPPRRRGRQHHAWRGARESGARGSFHPHSQAWSRRSARALLVRGRQRRDADARPAARCCTMRARSWRRPSGCARTSAPMPAGSPGRCACSPTPMRSPNFCRRR